VGKVTLLSISSTSADPVPWHAIRAVAEADFIFATTLTPTDLLRHAPGHADIIVDTDDPSVHSVMPFYDLASRGSFCVTRIFSGGISADQILEQVNRCRELCLELEIVRCS
jgi:precorrin-4 methylase